MRETSKSKTKLGCLTADNWDIGQVPRLNFRLQLEGYSWLPLDPYSSANTWDYELWEVTFFCKTTIRYRAQKLWVQGQKLGLRGVQLSLVWELDTEDWNFYRLRSFPRGTFVSSAAGIHKPPLAELSGKHGPTLKSPDHIIHIHPRSLLFSRKYN